MRLNQLLGVFIFLAAGFVQAAEETAVVTEGKINVRGKPSLVGEVITQLEQGEKVTILERITNSSAKAGESTNWAKIKLPPNTPVWVFSPFVKDGIVNVSRLNVRAGRGENYSVIGRLNRGEEVKPIRTVEEWMEVQQPTNAFAFVDLDLLRIEGAASTAPPSATPPPSVVPTRPPEVANTPVTPAASPVTTTESPQPTATTEIRTNATVVATTPATIPRSETSAEAPSTNLREDATRPVSTPEIAATAEPQLSVPEPVPSGTNISASSAAPTSVPTNGATVATSPLPATLPQVAPPIEKRTEPPPKRVVRREGIVRATTSIQAPTWYELEHSETKKRINYLFSDGMEINLKDYRGQKVVVTGEEAIDARWPNTPILDMKTLDVLPNDSK